MYSFFKSKYIISSGEKIYENSILVIKDGMVFDIVENNSQLPEEKIIDFKNAVITPGFVNLHTHLQYTDLKQEQILKRVQNDNCINFADWIINLMKQYFFWSESKKVKSFKNGLKETILSGCTCIAQLSREEVFIDILDSINLKSFIFLETFAESEENSNKEIEKLKKIINKKTSKNVIIGVSPHSIYNVHKTLWEKITIFAQEENILVHTHLAESQDEINWLNNKTSGIDKLHNLVRWQNMKPYEVGLNPVEYLKKTGILEKLKENLTVAHCIELDEKLIEKLVNYGVKIAYCPRSNTFLHKKTLNYNNLSASICKNSGLGTDSNFSNHDLSILNEAKFVKDYTGLDFKNILNMLTINSARILKIDNKTGSLDKGKDADFLVFDLNENQNYQSILNKENPDEIYIKGTQVAKNGQFTAEKWKFLNERSQKCKNP